MTEPIKPATDEEIAGWRDIALVDRPEDGSEFGIAWMDSDEWTYRLICRIEADRATIAELLARVGTLEDLIVRHHDGPSDEHGEGAVNACNDVDDEGAAILKRRAKASHA